MNAPKTLTAEAGWTHQDLAVTFPSFRDATRVQIFLEGAPVEVDLLYCTVLHCAVLYCTVLYCTVLCCAVLCCTVLLYCTVLYCVLTSCRVAASWRRSSGSGAAPAPPARCSTRCAPDPPDSRPS